MIKSLAEMSFEELGKLFPVVLTDYNPKWPEIYEAEKKKILKATGENAVAIHHIGSTAVEGLKAKPTIDILLEIKDDTNLDMFKDAITHFGYVYSEQKDNPPPHMTFYKGYTESGFKGQAYHLHIRYNGTFDEIIFRDCLRNDKKTREKYAELKTKLQKQFEFNREEYTKAKTEFIKETVLKAKILIRVMTEADYPMLKEFLYQAIFIPKGQKPPNKSVINRPEIFIYIEDFGRKDGDLGVVAEHCGQIVGAAWTRIIPAYGHLDGKTPELAISLVSKYRGKGIGTKLMEALFNLLIKKGYKQTSLSVQKDNPAVRFYERLGYKLRERLDSANHADDYLMVKELEK